MSSPIRKYPKTFIALALLLAALAYSYSWTYTPQGRLDYRAALSLHLLSFTRNYKPDENIDFEIPLPVNLIYMFSSLLPTEEVGKVQDVTIPAGDREIPARIYWPAAGDADQPRRTIVYFHGGGFVVGSVELYDDLTRSLANATDSIVVSVDYRLAPAHPFPAAFDDSYAATQWAAEHAASLGGDPARLFVAGDSAGGNLAAVVALKARDQGAPTLAGQILYYPSVDITGAPSPSRRNFSDGYGLSTAVMKKFSSAYVAGSDPAVPYISPLYAETVADLPPALVVTAGFDPLTSAAQAYAERMSAAGVPVVTLHFSGMIHGFMSVRLFSQRAGALQATAQFLQGR